jgi:hypothetical protein
MLSTWFKAVFTTDREIQGQEKTENKSKYLSSSSQEICCCTSASMAFPGNVLSLVYGDRSTPQRKSLTAASALYKAENTNLNSSLTCQRSPQDGAKPGAATLCDDNRASATSLTKHNTSTLLLQTYHHRSHPPHARRCHLSRVTPAKAVSCCLEASKGLAHDPWNKWEYYRIF